MTKQLPVVEVSDHALVRYLQRALDLDMDALRERLAKEAKPFAAVGANAFSVGNQKFCIRYGVPGKAIVTTVLERQMGSADVRARNIKNNHHSGKGHRNG